LAQALVCFAPDRSWLRLVPAECLAPFLMAYSRSLLLFILCLPGAARRSIRIGDSVNDSLQQTNTFTNALEVSAHAREALLPGGFGTALRRGPQKGALHAPSTGRTAPVKMNHDDDTQAWFVRRSVTKYDSKPVPADVVQSSVRAATLAPCHFMTEPWRFYEAGPDTRARLLALNPEKEKLFAGVPGWMVVTVAASEYGTDGSISTKKGLEDHAATACAVQNFMLALADHGVGSKWMTGALGVDPSAVMEVVGADQDAERFMGVVWYGYPETELKDLKAPKRKLGNGMHKVLP